MQDACSVRSSQFRSIVFNGENKQARIIKDGKLVGEYDYNGEGQRVRKRTYDANGALQDTTVFVYSAGKLVAEYTTAAPPQNPTTRYTATDMLVAKSDHRQPRQRHRAP